MTLCNPNIPHMACVNWLARAARESPTSVILGCQALHTDSPGRSAVRRGISSNSPSSGMALPTWMSYDYSDVVEPS